MPEALFKSLFTILGGFNDKTFFSEYETECPHDMRFVISNENIYVVQYRSSSCPSEGCRF